MLDEQNSILVIIDIQEKLVNIASAKEKVIKNSEILTKTAIALNLPTIVTEQYPKGLGDTISSLKNILSNSCQYIEKTSFSALKTEAFVEELKKHNKKQIILCGIETHICVLQTAIDLVKNGYEVFLISDVSSSRNEIEHNMALDLAKQYGIKVLSTEIAMFQLLKSSKHSKFKELQALIK